MKISPVLEYLTCDQFTFQKCGGTIFSVPPFPHVWREGGKEVKRERGTQRCEEGGDTKYV